MYRRTLAFGVRIVLYILNYFTIFFGFCIDCLFFFIHCVQSVFILVKVQKLKVNMDGCVNFLSLGVW